MLAMQYSIQLPANYEAEQIHSRVEARSKLFDGHGGLVHKTFLYNDADKLYAPFYVWKDVNEAQKFLLDDLFMGVIESFRRQRVRHWYVLQMAYGNRALTPAYALKEVDLIAPEEKLKHYLEKEKHDQAELLKNEQLYMHVIALDADRWEILRFSLWNSKDCMAKPSCDTYQDYQVLHVCEPNID